MYSVIAANIVIITHIPLPNLSHVSSKDIHIDAIAYGAVVKLGQDIEPAVP